MIPRKPLQLVPKSCSRSVNEGGGGTCISALSRSVWSSWSSAARGPSWTSAA